MRILIAEDDAVSATILQVTLENAGYEVIVSVNGASAIASATLGSSRPIFSTPMHRPTLLSAKKAMSIASACRSARRSRSSCSGDILCPIRTYSRSLSIR